MCRPPPEIVGLLPLYDLLQANEAFGALLLAEVASAAAGRPAPQTFLAVFVSTASYLFCHASVSVRSRMASRLALLILTIIVDAGSAIAGPECAVEVRLCRQVRSRFIASTDRRSDSRCSRSPMTSAGR